MLYLHPKQILINHFFKQAVSTVLHKSVCNPCINEASQQWCVLTVRFQVLHAHVLFIVPLGLGTYHSQAQTIIRAVLLSGKLPTTRGAATTLQVQTFNHIVDADTSPMFTGKVAVDQRFLSAILLLVRFLQLHGAQFFYHGSGFLTGNFLALLGVDRPSTLLSNAA